jgi:hypothetical protein
MIHKFQNIYGITYVINSNLKDYKTEFLKLISDITEDKKLPFSDIYIKMPLFMSQKFMDIVWESGLKYKEIETRHDVFMIKF